MTDPAQSSNPLKAIRAKCLDCVCYQPALVAECHIVTCALHPFRMGKNPLRKHRVMSDEQRRVLAERLSTARLAKATVVAAEIGKDAA